MSVTKPGCKQSLQLSDCYLYAENIKNNVEEIVNGDVKFMNPFMAMTNVSVLTKQLVKFGTELHIPENEVTAVILPDGKKWKMSELIL